MNAQSKDSQHSLSKISKKSYSKKPTEFDWKRLTFILLGIILFLVIYFIPDLPDAVDPYGKHFVLSHQAKSALALFFLAGTWWIFEVLPIGVTSIVIGVVQVLFFIRPADVALKDFMDPSVWFIFASLTIGMAFTRSGLTKRLAYNMLTFVGEKTSMIYLGSFLLIMALTLVMAHTAVAAAVFPLLVTIYSLYDENEGVTKFGKGLFIGMAYVAGAGSIITLLGSARGIVALGLFKEKTGIEIGFFELTYYLLPVGLAMLLIIWALFLIIYKPEKNRIEGLQDKVKVLREKLGKISKNELLTIIFVGLALVFLGLQSFIPQFKPFNKSAILLLTTISFFIFKILSIKDLEEIPWNIILLFGGAMSIGFCLWQTGAANWLAVHWLTVFQKAPWIVFVLGIAFFVLIMTNFIMNVAAIAISLPVAFAIAPYLGVESYVILFASLVTAGMPFMLLIGAAPNAIAYESKQFTSAEFFRIGAIMSLILMIVLAVFVYIVWPLMGMPILMK